MTDPIQSLWIGGELSQMEQLSIASFLAHGHEYHLYSYGEVGGLPKGAVLKKAEEILPKAAIFQYQQHPSYSGFSNFFRYRLLLRKGGWWVDTDVVCLKPFVFDAPYVFAAERIPGGEVAASAVIKAPAASEIMAFNWHVCLSCADPARAAWGQLGPKLIARAIRQVWALRASPNRGRCFARSPMMSGNSSRARWARLQRADACRPLVERDVAPWRARQECRARSQLPLRKPEA